MSAETTNCTSMGTQGQFGRVSFIIMKGNSAHGITTMTKGQPITVRHGMMDGGSKVVMAAS